MALPAVFVHILNVPVEKVKVEPQINLLMVEEQLPVLIVVDKVVDIDTVLTTSIVSAALEAPEVVLPMIVVPELTL